MSAVSAGLTTGKQRLPVQELPTLIQWLRIACHAVDLKSSARVLIW